LAFFVLYLTHLLSIAVRNGCEIKFQCQSRYVDADTGEETFTNSYVDPFQELNGEFESFDNVTAQSNGIMFDVVALNRNISIRHIELHLIETEYAPVNVSVYATLYNDDDISLDYNNGQPDFSQHYVFSYEGVRRHPTAWEDYTGGVVPQMPYSWEELYEGTNVFVAAISSSQLRPICVLANSSRGIYIYVNSGPSPLYLKYNESNKGDVYVTQGPDDLGNLIQLKVGIGLGKDKFYPPYINGLAFSGLMRYNYAFEEVQTMVQKGGQYSTIGVASSSCRGRSTSFLLNNFTFIGLLIVLFIW